MPFRRCVRHAVGMPRRPADRPLSVLQQERSRDTRRRLVTHAARLWAVKGFEATSITDITDAAGVSKATFYSYFRRKEDLLLELTLATSGRMADDWRLIETTDIDTLAALEALVHSLTRRAERTRPELLTRIAVEGLMSINRYREMRTGYDTVGATLHAVVERGQARGEIRSDRDPAVLVDILNINMLTAIARWGVNPEADLADAVWQPLQLILEGSLA